MHEFMHGRVMKGVWLAGPQTTDQSQASWGEGTRAIGQWVLPSIGVGESIEGGADQGEGLRANWDRVGQSGMRPTGGKRCGGVGRPPHPRLG